MAKTMQFTLQFNANTDNAKRQMRDLQSAIDQAINAPMKNTQNFGLTPKLQEAQKTAIQFLERKWVSFASSDAHNPYHRTPDLLEGYSFVATNFGETVANDIFSNNPLAVIKEIEK